MDNKSHQQQIQQIKEQIQEYRSLLETINPEIDQLWPYVLKYCKYKQVRKGIKQQLGILKSKLVLVQRDPNYKEKQVGKKHDNQLIKTRGSELTLEKIQEQIDKLTQQRQQSISNQQKQKIQYESDNEVSDSSFKKELECILKNKEKSRSERLNKRNQLKEQRTSEPNKVVCSSKVQNRQNLEQNFTQDSEYSQQLNSEIDSQKSTKYQKVENEYQQDLTQSSDKVGELIKRKKNTYHNEEFQNAKKMKNKQKNKNYIQKEQNANQSSEIKQKELSEIDIKEITVIKQEGSISTQIILRKMKLLNQYFNKLKECDHQQIYNFSPLGVEDAIQFLKSANSLLEVFLQINSNPENKFRKPGFQFDGYYQLYKYVKIYKTPEIQDFITKAKEYLAEMCSAYSKYIPKKIIDIKKEDGKVYCYVQMAGFRRMKLWRSREEMPNYMQTEIREHLKAKFRDVLN